jgi:hypothetical protein
MPSVASMPESQALKHLHELAVMKSTRRYLCLDFSVDSMVKYKPMLVEVTRLALLISA